MVNYYREEAGCQRCCFELEMWHQLEQHFKSSRFESKRTFDAVLAITLIGNAVEVFYTRNAKASRLARKAPPLYLRAPTVDRRPYGQKAEEENICTEDHKGHKGEEPIDRSLLPGCRPRRHPITPTRIHFLLQIFVIFATFCEILFSLRSSV